MEEKQNDLINLNAIIKQIVGDPNCKLSACHGKGYIGVSVDKEGNHRIILCKCGNLAQTDWVTLTKMLETMKEQITLEHQAIMRYTFFGGIAYRWSETGKTIKRLTGRIRRWMK